MCLNTVGLGTGKCFERHFLFGLSQSHSCVRRSASGRTWHFLHSPTSILGKRVNWSWIFLATTWTLAENRRDIITCQIFLFVFGFGFLELNQNAEHTPSESFSILNHMDHSDYLNFCSERHFKNPCISWKCPILMWVQLNTGRTVRSVDPITTAQLHPCCRFLCWDSYAEPFRKLWCWSSMTLVVWHCKARRGVPRIRRWWIVATMILTSRGRWSLTTVH